MKPIEFEGQNTIFAKDQPGYLPLPAKVVGNEVYTCWQLSDEDLKKIKKTKCIWLGQMNFQQPLQPQILTVNKEDLFV